ncbi:tetratricopeptide repeat protein [Evansella sp. AB-P1]|uniref:tetratricopeptide repeat protein n=1 Tax=Evansella sp. AB-P1 TaxID=3037653 RepID=UPI00241BEDC3|nr:tetratricopeptide repeat protein [Evansella sp. AB-P1]MDG5787156.1 tetratricopeptide repeat protein [Evansella sp. AB-P1]
MATCMICDDREKELYCTIFKGDICQYCCNNNVKWGEGFTEEDFNNHCLHCEGALVKEGYEYVFDSPKYVYDYRGNRKYISASEFSPHEAAVGEIEYILSFGVNTSEEYLKLGVLYKSIHELEKGIEAFKNAVERYDSTYVPTIEQERIDRHLELKKMELEVEKVLKEKKKSLFYKRVDLESNISECQQDMEVARTSSSEEYINLRRKNIKLHAQFKNLEVEERDNEKMMKQLSENYEDYSLDPVDVEKYLIESDKQDFLVDLYINLGECYKLLGEYTAAGKYFGRALKLDNTRSSVFRQLGDIYFVQAIYAQMDSTRGKELLTFAVEQYEQSLAVVDEDIDPLEVFYTEQESAIKLITCYLQTGSLGNLLNVAHNYLDKFYSNWDEYKSKVIQHRQGETVEENQTIEMKTLSDVYYAMSFVYFHNQQYAMAKNYIDRSLFLQPLNKKFDDLNNEIAKVSILNHTIEDIKDDSSMLEEVKEQITTLTMGFSDIQQGVKELKGESRKTQDTVSELNNQVEEVVDTVKQISDFILPKIELTIKESREVLKEELEQFQIQMNENNEENFEKIEKIISKATNKMVEKTVQLSELLDLEGNDLNRFTAELNQLFGFHWLLLKEESKKFLVTALLVYERFNDINKVDANTIEKVDFSPALLCAVKALEVELSHWLYSPIVDFYTKENRYIRKVEITEKERNPKYNKRSIDTNKNKMTLGAIPIILNNVETKPFIHLTKMIFKPNTIDNEIDRKKLKESIERISTKRNAAAHKCFLSKREVDNIFNLLFYKEKIFPRFMNMIQDKHLEEKL